MAFGKWMRSDLNNDSKNQLNNFSEQIKSGQDDKAKPF